MIKHLDIKISGYVQGVNFRWAAQAKAKSLHLAGFVKNQPDGSVYIEAEGLDGKLSEFLNWCRRGPDWSHVQTVDAREAGIKNFKQFNILY